MRIFIFMLFLFLFELNAKVSINQNGQSALVEVDMEGRGDINFVIFHNDKAIVIPCKSGKCKQSIPLSTNNNSKNIFQWKDENGNLQTKTVEKGFYTLEIFGERNKKIERGTLTIDGKKYEIHNGKVLVEGSPKSQLKVVADIDGRKISKTVSNSNGKISLQKKAVKVGSCDDINKGGKDKPENYIFDLGSIDEFTLEYRTYSVKDRIVVYQNGNTLFDTGCVGESKVIKGIKKDKAISTIEVDVQPNCDGDTGTSWDFKIICPK